MYDGTIYVGGGIASLGIDCVEAEWTADDTELVERKFSIYGLGTPPKLRKFVRQEALQLRQPRAQRAEAACSRGVMTTADEAPDRRRCSAEARSSRPRSSTTST